MLWSGAWSPPGHEIGYEHGFVHEVYEMLQPIAGGFNPSPDFEDGLKRQEIFAAVEKSVNERCWVRMNRI